MKKTIFFYQLAIVLCVLTAVLAGVVTVKVQIVSRENARLTAELATKDKALTVALSALDEVYASAFNPDTGVSSVEDVPVTKQQETTTLTPIDESAITVLAPCGAANKPTEFGFDVELTVVYAMTLGIESDSKELPRLCGDIGKDYLLNVAVGAGSNLTSGNIHIFSLETQEEWVISYYKNNTGEYILSPSSPGIQAYFANPFSRMFWTFRQNFIPHVG